MSLDWDLYCALYRATDSPLWGAVSHPDVAGLARTLGVTRITVWRRIKEWHRIGFLPGYEFLPNPREFGSGFELVSVRHENAGYRAAFLDELELVDGAFYAEQSFGSDTRVLWITLGPAGRERRRKFVARLPGVQEVGPAIPTWLPEPTRPLRRADWRLISALRSAPSSSFAQLGTRLGISPRTASRRFFGLRSEHAMLTYSLEDFAKFPGTVALLEATLAPGHSSREVAARLRERSEGLLELVSVDRTPFREADHLRFLVEAANVARVEQIEVAIGRDPSVLSARSRFLGASRIYRGWFDDRVHQALAASGVARARSSSSQGRPLP